MQLSNDEVVKSLEESIRRLAEAEALTPIGERNLNAFLQAISLIKELAQMKQDIQSVIYMLEGDADRKKVVNYIKTYLGGVK